MTITAKFDSFCKTCRCKIVKGESVIWTRGVQGVTHISKDRCDATRTREAAARAAAPVPADAPKVDGAPVVAFLTAARDRGLKFPKVRFADANGREIALTLAGSTSKYPGAVQVKLAGEWIGRVEASGVVAGPLSRNVAMIDTLRTIAADPATAAKTYGMLTGNCSFCAKQLTDAGSVEVGYGPVCAKKYGLPHTAKGSGKVVTLPEVPMTTSELNAVIADTLTGDETADELFAGDVHETAYDVAPDSETTFNEAVNAAAEAYISGDIDIDTMRERVQALVALRTQMNAADVTPSDVGF